MVRGVQKGEKGMHDREENIILEEGKITYQKKTDGQYSLITVCIELSNYKTLYSCLIFICSENTNETQFQLMFIIACGVHKPSTVVYQKNSLRECLLQWKWFCYREKGKIFQSGFSDSEFSVLFPTEASYLDYVNLKQQ